MELTTRIWGSSDALELRDAQQSSGCTTPTLASSGATLMANHSLAFEKPLPGDALKYNPTEWSNPRNDRNPFNWRNSKKWRVTILASFMTFVIQVNGTMLTSAAEQINESFHVSDEKFPHSYWPVLSWNLGGAAAPMFGLPLMENFGVRKSYMVCNHTQ
jgi:hypothetical protein